MLQRPPVDVREAPLKKNQEVRIIHPHTKETQDVTICNGFKRANQKSWYRVVDQKGKKSVLDMFVTCYIDEYSLIFVASCHVHASLAHSVKTRLPILFSDKGRLCMFVQITL